MGKRSGVPHRDDELAQLSAAELEDEFARCRSRQQIPMSAKTRKAWLKRRHWLERAADLRNS